MEVHKLDQMTKGWFVGDFEPTVIHSTEMEVGVKYYKAGDKEERHVHKIATELTTVVTGRIRMNGKECIAGDIIEIKPNEATDFEALEDSVTVVVKNPSVMGDKYPVE